MKTPHHTLHILTNLLLMLLPLQVLVAQLNGYVFKESADSVVSMEAEHFYQATPVKGTTWQVIPHSGKTLSALTLLPTTIDPKGASLEYRMQLNTQVNQVKVHVYLTPTLNFDGHEGMLFTLAFDGQKPVQVNMNGGVSEGRISQWQKNRINEMVVSLTVPATKDNKHSLVLAPLSPAIVIQKIVVDCGGLKPSYLGPTESVYSN